MKRLSKQSKEWLEYLPNDESGGDIGDRANVLAELYRTQALQSVLGIYTSQSRNKRTHRKYRKCERCGKRIPKQRLAAWSRATRCIECQKQFEQALPNHRRFVCT